MTVMTVGFNVLLIPRLGTLGAALGTVIAGGVVSLYAFTRFWRGRWVVSFERGMSLRPDWAIIRQLFRFGLPSGLQGVAMNIGGVLLLRFIGSLAESAAAQAAYAVGYTELFSLITWTSVGLMGATAAVAGQNLGAGHPERAMQAVNVAARMRQEEAPVGGEGNGGVILQDLHLGRDAPAGAALILAMVVLRRTLRLEAYLERIHFVNLGKLLLLMSLLWGYFTFVERLTVWYGNEPSEMAVFWATQTGAYAPLFWTMIVCNFVVPFVILSVKKLRTIGGCVAASLAVVAGMWLERFLIIVPSLSHKYLPYTWGSYRPQPIEIIITTSTFAAMMLLYVLFSKLVPIISIWELKTGQHYVADATPREAAAHPLLRAHP